MSLPKFERLLERVDELARLQQSLGDTTAPMREDARDLVEELVVYGNQTVNFPSLSLRLEERAALDILSLREAARYLHSLVWPDSIAITPELTIRPAEKLAALEADITDLQIASDPTPNVALVLDFKLAGTMLQLVMGAIRSALPLEELVRLAKIKIDLLDKQQVVQIWSYLQREFETEVSTPLEVVPGIVPDDILRFGSDAVARDKLARYIVEWKPRLMLALYDRRGSGYPLEVPSLPRVLTWKASNTINSPSLPEVRLAKSMGRIAHIAAKLFNDSVGEFAAVLQLDVGSQVIRSGGVVTEQPTFLELFYEVRKAARLLSEFAVVDADFPVAIQRYRWGLEVMAPHLTEEFKKKDELLLQRELARFTLERGLYVVGTRFGRAETDLVSWQKEALYIVETKLFRGKGHVRPKSIRDAIAQLRNYMDQHPSTPRGVLVLYNLTLSHISAPERWLTGRFLIVPINMQPTAPSRRVHSLEIIEGDEDEIIKVVPLVRPPYRRAKKKKVGRKST